MAPPPAKKQKRLTVLSLDEDEHGEESRHANGSRPRRRVLTTGKSEGKSTATSLPTRAPAKPNSFAPRKNSLSSGKPTPNSSSYKPNRKGLEAGTIRTFFNAVTQTQQVSGAAMSTYLSQQVEEEDLIEDDSLDEELWRRFSSTQQELQSNGLSQSRTPHISAEVSTRNWKQPSALQKFPPADRTKLSHALHETSAGLEETKPWAEKFGPTSLEELAVHKKKVADVRSWLTNVMDGQDRKRLLVLKGPSGTGKTATISTLAKAMDFDTVEWRNPLGSEYASEAFRSLSTQFEDFLERSGKFGSLTLEESIRPKATGICPSPSEGQSGRKKAILLEEFPNIFPRTSSALSSFRSNVLQYLAASTPSAGAFFTRKEEDQTDVTPLIMIISETLLTTTSATADSFTAHRLLGTDILNHPGTTMIEFNPIAPTFLTKALQLVMHKEARCSGRRRTPGPALLKKLGEVGDVRSAIGSLEFMCLRGDDSGDWGGRVASVAKKGAKAASAMTKMEHECIEMVTQREATLDIFHAVGKVVYNKREDVPAADPHMEPPVQPPNHLSDFARPRVSLVNVEELMDETGTDTPTFIAALHENYVMSCEGPTSTDALNGCIEALSDSDLFGSDRHGGLSMCEGFSNRIYQGSDSESLRQNEMCFHVAVRGILFALPYPIKRQIPPGGRKGDAFKMFYPTSMRLWKQAEEIEGLIDHWMDPYRSALKLQPGHSGRSNRGVDTWKTRSSSPLNEPPGLADINFSPTLSLLMGGNSARTEMILERLPYITKIECRHLNSSRMRELEKMTKFHGVGQPTDEVPDEDDVTGTESSAATTTRSQFRSAATTAAKGKDSQGLASTASVTQEEEKLVLSDDDIEDD
ncbi:Cell cycle checkpoint protein rad17 [Trapelia coarctata]|nr:Cell cycle checkpoint protein rad17 [Trapelia coarctata]